MEKKGTKIAYFVALAVVVVALVIAKVTNDGSGFVATGWALFPPVVAIALASSARKCILPCSWALAAALLLANFQPWQMVVNFIGAGEGVGMINAIDISILIFLVILGIMVDLMNKAGGSAPSAAGQEGREDPLRRTAADHAAGRTDLHRRLFQLPDRGRRDASRDGEPQDLRAKLAYVIDATAAPCFVCWLRVLWAAAVASYVPDGFPGSVSACS